MPGEANEFPRLLNSQKKEVTISSQFQRQRTPVPVQKVRKTGQRTKERKLTSLIPNSLRQCTKGGMEVIPLGLSTHLPWIHSFRSGRKQIRKQAVMSLLQTFNIHQLLGRSVVLIRAQLKSLTTKQLVFHKNTENHL